MDITNRIKAIIDYENLNITQFSEKIGVKRQQAQDVLLGRQKPPQEFLIKIVENLHIDANWLLTGEGEMQKGKIGAAQRPHPISDQRAQAIVMLYEALNEIDQKEILAAIEKKKRLSDARVAEALRQLKEPLSRHEAA